MSAFATSAEDRAYAASLFESYSTALSEFQVRKLLLDITGITVDSNIQSARSLVNQFVLQHYPNETTIRSNFINKVLLPLNTDNISIFEFPIGDSRVDICKVNGHSAAYEIKTELDSFFRLEKQLQDYSDVFESVYIIVPESRLSDLHNQNVEKCGIYSYRQLADGSYIFFCRRKAAPTTNLNAEKQLQAISKKGICELFSVHKSRMTKDELIDSCLSTYTSKHINKAFKRYLKERYKPNWQHLRLNNDRIYEIDYEWFYRSLLEPEIVY